MRSFFRRKNKNTKSDVGLLVGNEKVRRFLHTDFMSKGDMLIVVISDENENPIDIHIYIDETFRGHIDPDLIKNEKLDWSDPGAHATMCTGCLI